MSSEKSSQMSGTEYVMAQDSYCQYIFYHFLRNLSPEKKKGGEKATARGDFFRTEIQIRSYR